MRRLIGFGLQLCLALAACFGCANAADQGYPSKPISLVVLDAPGANADSGIVRKLSIRNLSVRPVEIFGVSATCSVNSLSQASSTINPFGVFEILVWVGPMKEIARNDLFVFTSLSLAPLRIDVSEFSGAAGKQKVHGE